MYSHFSKKWYNKIIIINISKNGVEKSTKVKINFKFIIVRIKFT